MTNYHDPKDVDLISSALIRSGLVGTAHYSDDAARNFLDALMQAGLKVVPE